MSRHCNPRTKQGSDNTYCYSKRDHLHGHLRECGAKTVVINQTTVFVNNRLWAVKGDPNDHQEGKLVNTGTSVFIGGIPVIVHAPDPATPDGYCAT
jgi:hypothetical protein